MNAILFYRYLRQGGLLPCIIIAISLFTVSSIFRTGVYFIKHCKPDIPEVVSPWSNGESAELQSYYYVHFRINTLAKGMIPVGLQGMG